MYMLCLNLAYVCEEFELYLNIVENEILVHILIISKKEIMAKNNPLSFESFTSFVSENFSLVLIILAVFITGFTFGSMWKENKILGEKNPAGEEKVSAEEGQPAEEAADPSLENLPPINEYDILSGAENPQVYLVEYSDFLCGFCNRVHPTMQKLLSEYPDQVAWAFRNFPILSESSKTAAQINLCVAEYAGNDEAVTFTDRLMTAIHDEDMAPEEENMFNIVSEIGVAVDPVRDCLESGEMEPAIEQIIEGGRSVGVGGTPTTILATPEGEFEMVNGAAPYEDFVEAVEKLLN